MRLPGRRSAGSAAVDGTADGAEPTVPAVADGVDGSGGDGAAAAADAGVAGAAAEDAGAPAKVKRPLYPRLLRLRHVRPNAWQRAALGEGALALAVVLVLADVASAWTLLALPVAVAAIVKAHDLLAGLLARPARVEPAQPVEGAQPAQPAQGAEPAEPRT